MCYSCYMDMFRPHGEEAPAGVTAPAVDIAALTAELSAHPIPSSPPRSESPCRQGRCLDQGSTPRRPRAKNFAFLTSHTKYGETIKSMGQDSNRDVTPGRAAG